MPKEIKDLSPNLRNPRHASDKKLDMLRKSMDRLGSLDGIVFNKRTNTLVGGHMRQKVSDPGSEIFILEKYTEPTDAGTVAYGFVMLNGERYPYREVDWDTDTEKAAGIAANKGAGFWDLTVLSELFIELDTINFDMNIAMFDDEERKNAVAPVNFVAPAPENTSQELNPTDFDNFKHECPKCGFEWDSESS